MKTMTRFAAAALVTFLFVGCESETKPVATETKAAEAPAAPGKAAKNAKSAAPSSSPSNKPID